MMVMLLGGLWHGAAWNFVMWGAIHGVMLAAERKHGKHSFYQKLPAPFRMLVTYIVVVFAWVFFRAEDISAALNYCSSMLGFGAETQTAELVGGQIYSIYHVATVIAAALICRWGVQTWNDTRRITWPKAAVIVVLFAMALLMLVATSFHPFIYFMF